MDADAVELRVLGCLIEKQRTTPDVYPLSLNALRLACNQSTNRDPVVDYDEPAIRAVEHGPPAHPPCDAVKPQHRANYPVMRERRAANSPVAAPVQSGL